ncbi:MAG: hypothetical protein KC912_03205 [Proteobacteria bacterium]|nr:hypothetical protein [Pseudomonadota bacterium]
MSKAAIDIGSNSLLLTIVDDDDVIVHDEARVVGLGRGLGDRGLIAPDRIKAADAVLVDYVNIAKTHGIDPIDIRAVATSAARRAMNAPTWLQRVQRKLGMRVRIIPGDEEARLTWRGALRDLALPSGPVLVVDLGGGSTELVLGEGAQVISRGSLEIGSVRMTEKYLGTGVHDPTGLGHLRKEVEIEVAKLTIHPSPRSVIGVAGTTTTLAAIANGLETYDSERVHGSKLTRTDLARFIDVLLPMSPDQRREFARVSPDRADYLLAGAVILERVLASSRRQSYVVSDRGVRFGLLAEA